MTRATKTRAIAGVVLAGGQSRRMGRDKADVMFEGRKLLDLAEDNLRQAGCASVYVSGRPERTNGIADKDTDQGPAHAMIDAIEFLGDRYGGALFLPVDMPLLQSFDLQPLISGDTNTCRAWVRHPLPAFIPVSAVLPARDTVRSVKSLLAALPTDWLVVEDGEADRFANINTPAELTAALKMR
ncbi:molybdenum cofactor guanylyltransferase [Hyphobacterium sp.]|uniref:molybdenum cofactor guanylyltransferase n=1 Tax=Hyphobacterium sp. TaxID=2004662 RepID=UPI003B52050B